jgi:hypothetical protein
MKFQNDFLNNMDGNGMDPGKGTKQSLEVRTQGICNPKNLFHK